MNTRLLRRVVREFLKEPRRLDMEVAIEHLPLGRNTREMPPCNTVSCIAGTAVLLVDKPKLKDGKIFDWLKCRPRATKLLQLTVQQAGRLFLLDRWPEEFREPYERVEYKFKLQAKILQRRVEHFVKTKGEE